MGVLANEYAQLFSHRDSDFPAHKQDAWSVFPINGLSFGIPTY